jgi:hypothetical protein
VTVALRTTGDVGTTTAVHCIPTRVVCGLVGVVLAVVRTVGRNVSVASGVARPASPDYRWPRE